MLCDPLFDIYKIRLDEEFCKRILEQMDCGNKIYPNDDIPDISPEIEKINKQAIFSDARFQRVMRDLKKTNAINAFRKSFEEHGIAIQGKLRLIDPERLKQINLQYTVDVARKKVNLNPRMDPLLIIS
jgi:dsDNA-specific endonuclease/ATPase MutS2